MAQTILSYSSDGNFDYLSGDSGASKENGITFRPLYDCIVDSLTVSINTIGGAVTGTAQSFIYAITGTPGSNAVPTGTALASSNYINGSTFTSTSTPYTFSYPTAYVLTGDTTYIITLWFEGGASSQQIAISEATGVVGENSAWYLNGTGWQHDSNMLAFMVSGTYAPVASFTTSQTNVAPNEDVTFTDISSNTPTSWSWDFDDGNTSTSQNPTHAYASAGTYNVVLTATNAAGSDTSPSTPITVVNKPSILGSSTITGLDNITF